MTEPQIGTDAGRDVERESSASAVLCEVQGLSTHIRMRRSTVEALDRVTLTVGAGETVGLVGESGCGKSITAMSIMRLLPPGGEIVEGSVRLNGRELPKLTAAQMREVRGAEVAMVFQDPMTSLNPTMTIGDQIAESVRVHRDVSKREALDRAVEMLELVGMPVPRERLAFYPHQLSGGLRQRVVIAMALACEPKLLIADEPTTALDVTIQAQILELLDEIKERLQMGMLLITHDLGVIAGRADRVLVMYAGRIVETGATAEIFRAMRHPYTQALLESVPELDMDRSAVLQGIAGTPPDLTSPPAGCRFAPRCRYAQERCRVEDPPLVDAEAGQRYACFFPVDGPRPRGAVTAPAHVQGRSGRGQCRSAGRRRPVAGGEGRRQGVPDPPGRPAAPGRVGARGLNRELRGRGRGGVRARRRVGLWQDDAWAADRGLGPGQLRHDRYRRRRHFAAQRRSASAQAPGRADDLSGSAELA